MFLKIFLKCKNKHSEMMQASALEKTRVPWETSLIWCCNRPSCTFMIKYSENENDIKQAKEKKRKKPECQ